MAANSQEPERIPTARAMPRAARRRPRSSRAGGGAIAWPPPRRARVAAGVSGDGRDRLGGGRGFWGASPPGRGGRPPGPYAAARIVWCFVRAAVRLPGGPVRAASECRAGALHQCRGRAVLSARVRGAGLVARARRGRGDHGHDGDAHGASTGRVQSRDRVPVAPRLGSPRLPGARRSRPADPRGAAVSYRGAKAQLSGLLVAADGAPLSCNLNSPRNLVCGAGVAGSLLWLIATHRISPSQWRLSRPRRSLHAPPRLRRAILEFTARPAHHRTRP